MKYVKVILVEADTCNLWPCWQSYAWSLYCCKLQSGKLFWILLKTTLLWWNELYCTVMYYIPELNYTSSHGSELYWTALYCIAIHRSVLANRLKLWRWNYKLRPCHSDRKKKTKKKLGVPEFLISFKMLNEFTILNKQLIEEKMEINFFFDCTGDTEYIFCEYPTG